MKRLQGQVSIQVVLCGMLCLASLPANAQAQADLLAPDSSQAPVSASVAKAQQIETFKMDGLTGKTVHVSDMIAVLKDTEQSYRQCAAWLALSRLGATEAIPTMDDALKLVWYSPDTPLGEFARACRARLLAQRESTPHAMAVRYFQELGETPEQLNTAVQQFIQKLQEAPQTHIVPRDIFKERNVVEELADLIYHGPAAGLLADPLVAQVDFSPASRAAVKVDLALLTPEQQRQKLVETLGHSNQLLDATPCGQLLIDLGRSQAIAMLTAKLNDMKQNRANYPDGAGLYVSRVLYIAGDTAQSPNEVDKDEIRQFTTDY